MLHQLVRRLTVVSGFALVMAMPSQAFAQNLLDWQALGGSGAIQSHVPFTMKSVTDKESLKHGSRVFGINLVWDKSTTLNNVMFDKQTGSGDVKYGEQIAVYLKGGGYLKYEKR